MPAREEGVPDPQDHYVQLKIEELDGTGAVVATHTDTHLEYNGWVQPSIAFHTTASTAKVRFWAIGHWYYCSNYSHVNYDDLALNGPSPNSKFVEGTVTSGGSPVANATVAVGAATATTAGDGTYSIELAGSTTEAVVRASSSSHFAQKKRRASRRRM